MMPFWHDFIELIMIYYLLTMFVPALLDFHFYGMSSINKLFGKHNNNGFMDNP